jgi:hypothetical protein
MQPNERRLQFEDEGRVSEHRSRLSAMALGSQKHDPFEKRSEPDGARSSCE